MNEFVDSKQRIKIINSAIIEQNVLMIRLIKIRRDRQTDGNARPISSSSRGHGRSRKRKSREPADALRLLSGSKNKVN